jgi:hypothetical protein
MIATTGPLCGTLRTSFPNRRPADTQRLAQFTFNEPRAWCESTGHDGLSKHIFHLMTQRFRPHQTHFGCHYCIPV